MLLLLLVRLFVNKATVTRRSYMQKANLKDYSFIHERLTMIICNSNHYQVKIRSIMSRVVANINLSTLENRFRKRLRSHCNENGSRTVLEPKRKPFDEKGFRTKTEAFTLSPENRFGTVKPFLVCSVNGV